MLKQDLGCKMSTCGGHLWKREEGPLRLQSQAVREEGQARCAEQGPAVGPSW